MNRGRLTRARHNVDVGRQVRVVDPRTVSVLRPRLDNVTMSTDKPNRRWYQFSMRTLLVVMLVFCVTVGWVGSRIYHAQRNSERVDAAVWASELANEKAVAQINMIGGSVDYFFKDGNTQSWLQKGFDDPGDDVSICQHVRFGGGSTSDADLAVLKRLSDVQSIEVSDTNITDAGLDRKSVV